MLDQSKDKRLLAKQPVLKLVGRYFHSLEKGADGRRDVVQWQGEVMQQINDEVYLVELFEWITGIAYLMKLVTLQEMLNWQFYDTAAEQMNNWYEYSYRPPEPKLTKSKPKRHLQIS